MLSIAEMIDKASKLHASDLHIVCGLPIRCRVRGEIQNLDETVLTAEDCENYARELAGKDYAEIADMGEIDLAATFNGSIRTRLNIFRQQGTVSVAIRILHDRIRTPQELRLPAIVQSFSNFRSGLVVVTGETGSGKSTTLASLIDEINHTRTGHVITLEDPIEYIYKPDKCVVNQREIGRDTKSYLSGLRAILREDPDVILIGEMRDYETIEAALTAAETGHLVFSTLHTNSAAETVDRIVSVFPAERQQQTRVQLSAALRAVVSQKLLPDTTGTGRIAACEVMMVNPAISNLIREGKTAQIESYISLGSQEGSISMDRSLLRMVSEGEITRSVAVQYAHEPERFPKG